jgi:carbon-monoxide dehydrogenase large subunit
VLADSAALAEDGIEAIALDIEELPVVADRHISGRDETLLVEEAGTNLAMKFTAIRGDVDAAFREADYTKRGRFSVQRHTALPMEARGLLAEWDAAAGRLAVMGAAKVPFFNRRTVAQMMGLPESAVDLIENDVGGGFGARGEFYPEDFLIPFAARHVGRPVMWIEDRREHLIAMNHARQMDCEVEIACKRDGTIVGLRGDVFVDLGAYIRTNRTTQCRPVLQRAVPHSEHPSQFLGAGYQQDPDRHLSRPRPV